MVYQNTLNIVQLQQKAILTVKFKYSYVHVESFENVNSNG